MKVELCVGILLVNIACLTSISALAGTSREAGKTQCAVFKDDKLLKKGVCGFEYYNSSNVTQSTDAMGFLVPSYGKIDFVRSATVDENASGDNYVAKSSIIEVNDKPATFQIRDMKTYKVLAVNKVPANLTIKYLNCYKQKKTNLEICYNPDFISSHFHD